MYKRQTVDRVPCVFVENGHVVGLDPNDPITVNYEHKVGDWPTGEENPELVKLKPSQGHNNTIVNGIPRIGWMTGGKSALWVDEDIADVITGKAKDFIINNGVIIVMFILVIYTGLTSDNFLTRNNLMNILMNMSSRLVIALGIAGCVITAGCDLSAGRMIGFGACISGMLLQRLDYSGKFFPDMKPLNVVLVAIIAMLICAAFGTVTGIFIAYLNVPPFIATLAMMEIVYGIGLIVTNATPLGGYVEAYTNVANKKFLGINYLIWIAIIVAAITWFIFNMTRHGKYMYAIGGNPQAAEVAGVPVKKTLILIYMKAAAMYGLAGFMLGAKAGGASVQTGYGYEMEAIAACTIGGVSVTGGRGKVSSAIIGVAVFELLKVALQYLGMNANAQYIAIGVVIFVAISLDIRKYIARK